ncbi:hypothetical protein [Pelagicoccus sp. SDUM812005]|uniref:DUF4870 domain-containing protein n=1 Tax=Pelagicoccus sp. SDUM812005 TaxID=3041257 RepID=UPI00280D0893|nr:hypothetical protein [Pelagicoccus sp. SDUM812005]MDQ8182676.1 hypothetical protein [Pelagicoccus sp. SDUM812005]
MDPKTRGIVAYLTIIGWVIALVTNNPKDEQTSFHLRQMLGIILLSVAASILAAIPLLGLLIWPIGMIAAFILWVIGLISAIEGSRKQVPFVGEYFQEWFKGL